MLMTIVAVILALIMTFFIPIASAFDATYLTVIFLVGGTSVFLVTAFLYTFILMPLEHLEQRLIPHVMDLIRHDKLLRLSRWILLTFVLVSYLCVASISRLESVDNQDRLFWGWLVFFGMTLDAFRASWNRFVRLLNPSFLVQDLSTKAVHAIQNDQYPQLLTELDNLAEIVVRSIEKTKLALSIQALQTFVPIIKIFLESSKSLSHMTRDLHAQQTGGDLESFTIFYLLQRLELMNDKALRDRQETVCRQMIVIMGKIIVQCARFDLSLVTFPTHFLTKFGLKAQQHHFDEVAVLTTSTLLEISKTILTEIDVTYAELQDPFRAILTGLDALAKGAFKKRKDTSIKVLTQPFLDLKALFQNEKMAHHRDTPVILAEIDRLLGEYSVLEQVMQAIPPIPELGSPEGFTSPQTSIN